MSGQSPEEIRAHVKVYLMVFGALAVLTAVTVGASYLDIGVAGGITLALLIAAIKASLVALYFMHLKGEVKAVLQTLILTAVFFVFLMFLPLFHAADYPGMPQEVQAPQADSEHGGEEH